MATNADTAFTCRRGGPDHPKAMILRLFVAEGSGPSDAMRNRIDALLADHDDSIVVEEIDAWEHPESIVANSVLALPTLVVLRSDRELARLVGPSSARRISKAIAATGRKQQRSGTARLRRSRHG